MTNQDCLQNSYTHLITPPGRALSAPCSRDREQLLHYYKTYCLKQGFSIRSTYVQMLQKTEAVIKSQTEDSMETKK